MFTCCCLSVSPYIFNHKNCKWMWALCACLFTQGAEGIAEGAEGIANWYAKSKAPWRFSQHIYSTSKPKLSRPTATSQSYVSLCSTSMVGMAKWVRLDSCLFYDKDSQTMKCHVCTEVICGVCSNNYLYIITNKCSGFSGLSAFSTDKRWHKKRPCTKMLHCQSSTEFTRKTFTMKKFGISVR